MLGIGDQLSKIVEGIKPYKEIAVLLIGLFSAISAGIAWTVSHFATAAALSELECRISHDNGVKALADGAAATDAATELRHAQMRVLTAASQSDDEPAACRGRCDYCRAREGSCCVCRKDQQCLRSMLARHQRQQKRDLAMKGVLLILVLWATAGITAATAQNTQPGECPSPELIDCTPTQSCARPRDGRDCNRCVFSVFGRCQVRGNDPACEAAKAAQNSAYDVEKAACETEKSGQKAL